MVIKRASGTRTNHCIYTLQSLVLNINCFSFNAPVLHVIVIVHIPQQFWFHKSRQCLIIISVEMLNQPLVNIKIQNKCFQLFWGNVLIHCEV